MAVTLEIPYRASFESARSPDATFAFLSDGKASLGALFPGLRRFEETAPGEFAWEFDEVGFQSIRLKIAFRTRMVRTPPDSIQLVPGTDPHKLALHWVIKSHGDRARVFLDLTFTVEVPVPSLMKGLVSGFARTELTKFLERYTANVEQALST